MKDWLNKAKPKGKLREDEKLNVPNSPVPASQLPNKTQKNYIVPDVIDKSVRDAKPAPESLPKTKITYLKSNSDSEAQRLKNKFKKKVESKAAGGGLSRDKNYGSKEKPYPTVKKGDFAGGSRSYPIPTKADAVDALRLAGLHNRPDVKAKVYKKFPSLKK